MLFLCGGAHTHFDYFKYVANFPITQTYITIVHSVEIIFFLEYVVGFANWRFIKMEFIKYFKICAIIISRDNPL